MTAIRWSIALALLWSIQTTCSAFGQQGRRAVEVMRLTDDDLRRTAHQLRVSEQRLRDARQALQEATDLLQEVEVNKLGVGASLPNLWVRIHRQQSPDRLAAMIAAHSKKVSELQNVTQYQILTQWALQTASQLAPVHPTRALQAIQSWPAPPRWLGEQAVEEFEKLQAGLERQGFSDDFAVDPAGSLRGLMNHSSALNRFQLNLSRMRRSGDREEANRMIDEVLAEFGNQPANARSYWQYTNLIQQSRFFPHDRTSQLHQGLISALQQGEPEGAESQTYLFEAGGQEVELQQQEFRFLQSLKQFHRQPETILKLVDSWPSMGEKIDQLGGLDRAMQALPSKIRRAGNPKAEIYAGRNRAAVNDWVEELKFEAFSRPWKVNRRLDELVAQQGDESVEILIQIAYMSASNSPELAQLALERAEPLIEQAEDAQAELLLFMRYGHCYANLEGALTPKLIEHGFALLDQLKQAQQEGSLDQADPRRRGYGSVSSAEAFLVGHLARVNFAEALAEARSREEPAEQVRLLLAIVERLVN